MVFSRKVRVHFPLNGTRPMFRGGKTLEGSRGRILPRGTVSPPNPVSDTGALTWTPGDPSEELCHCYCGLHIICGLHIQEELWEVNSA